MSAQPLPRYPGTAPLAPSVPWFAVRETAPFLILCLMLLNTAA